jgi:hypothetical protein
MKTIALFSVLALSAVTSTALAGERTTLTDGQMDKITAGTGAPFPTGYGTSTAYWEAGGNAGTNNGFYGDATANNHVPSNIYYVGYGKGTTVTAHPPP